MIGLLVALSLQSIASPDSFVSDLNNFKNRSLSIQTEKQNLESYSDLLVSKKLFWTPKLSLSAIETQTKVNSTSTSDINYLQTDLSLNLFKGGADLRSLGSAQAQYKSQEYQVLNQTLKVELKAADLIFKSIYLSESLRIQEQVFKLKEESLRIVKDRYNQGRLPSQEVIKSEVDLSQQKNKLRLANLELAENKSEIAALFISEVQTKEWPFDEKTTIQTDPSEKIPQIDQKFWITQAREFSWREAKGSHWPTLDLQVSMQEFDIKKRDSSQLLGTLTFTLPLWSRFETSAAVSSQFSQFISAQNDYKETEQVLKQRSIYLKEKIVIARRNLEESKKNLQSARKLYDDVINSFKVGRISTNDLFIEQNRLLESENILATSQLTFHQGLIETCVLFGFSAQSCLK